MADKDELQSQFVAVTGVDQGRAKFFLESAQWDLQVAIAHFYDTAGDDDMEETSPQAAGTSAAPPGDSAKGGSRSQGSSRFGSVAAFRRQESESDEEEGQAYYAGGSEHGGGQQILGPPKKKPNPSTDDVVDKLFQSAKDHGAETVEPEEAAARPKPLAFKGTGYRLGATEEDTQVVQGERDASRRQEKTIVLRMWKNGFTVDDGELRAYDDPANQEFLNSINKGEVPLELIRMCRGLEVALNLEDHRHEEWAPPRVAVKAFSGEGHKLGSPTPNVVSAPAAAAGSGDRKTNEAKAQSNVGMKDSEPTTSIQIRLADGSRLVAKFNHTNRVSDVRQFIATARPETAVTPFVLMTTFPNKELTDESQTLKEANLLNAVIVQKMK
ncbi:NSFL1 cofactor p47-like [Branchiostoma floridae]|uniref:NSFL1 cofactor p47 n=1 Tax=Branchiostoma floridae TaxID=7739 RepID=A0A9J7HPW9_BRAFL|nr:NSFL1 cofactor p47-like [Branchiostoma floridae]